MESKPSTIERPAFEFQEEKLSGNDSAEEKEIKPLPSRDDQDDLERKW